MDRKTAERMAEKLVGKMADAKVEKMALKWAAEMD